MSHDLRAEIQAQIDVVRQKIERQQKLVKDATGEPDVLAAAAHRLHELQVRHLELEKNLERALTT